MIEKIEKYFQNNGYRNYPKNNIIHPHSDGSWQKKIGDEKGIRYFINFVFYSGHTYPNGIKTDDVFMAEIVNNEPHQTYQIHHLDTVDKIRDAENKIELFWKTFGTYYENY